jgi:hypothetical protein
VSTLSPAKAGVQTAEGKIRSQDHRAALVTPRHDLEEQVGLLACHRQVADLIDDQKLVGVDRAMHDLAVAALALGGFEHQHEVSRAEEARLVTCPCRIPIQAAVGV